MGIHLFVLVLSSFLLTGCFQNSNYGKSQQPGISGDNDLGDDDTDIDPLPTDNTGISAVSNNPVGTQFNPQNSYYTTIKGTAENDVENIFVFINGCTTLALLRSGEVIDSSQGVSATEFENNGLELDLSTQPMLTKIRIYLKTKKTDGTFSRCIEKYSYYHNIEAPINFSAFSTKAAPTSSSDWTTESNLSSNLANPFIKLSIGDENILNIKLYKNSTTCAETALLGTQQSKTTFETTGAQITFTEQELINIYAKGFGNNSFSSACKKIASYRFDNVAPSSPASISHKLVSSDRNASPLISWAQSTDTNGSGVSHYLYYVGTSATPSANPTWKSTAENSNITLQFTSNLSYNSRYYVHVKAVDNAGNMSTIRSSVGWRVYPSSELPALTITDPVQSSTVAAVNLNISGTCIGGSPVTLSTTSQGIEAQSAAELMCNATTNTFTFPIKVLPNDVAATSNQRSLQVVQNDGSENISSNTVVINYVPLNPNGLELSSGAGHSCVIKDSKAYCWGAGTLGQAGSSTLYQASNGALLDVSQPLKITKGGTASDFLKVSAGRSHSCGILSNKTAYCWGDNSQYQLANTGGNTAVPQRIGTFLFEQIAAGARHTCGITADTNKLLYCWGDNQNRQLGSNNTASKVANPEQVNLDTPSGFTGAKALQVVAGDGHTCAIVKHNSQAIYKALCWGRNDRGQLGFIESIVPSNADKANQPIPKIVSDEPLGENESFKYLAAGAFHTCGITNFGHTYCWGYNNYGALGTGTTTTLFRPTPNAINPPDIAVPISFSKIAVGGNFASPFEQVSCAISTTQKLYCWGANNYGQVGRGIATTTTSIRAPMAIRPDLNFEDVSVGDKFSCAKTTTGDIYCWGAFANKRLGNTSLTTNQVSPVLIPNNTFSSN